jgi:hypothetical protein
VVPTTNHLRRWQNQGRKLRLDVLLQILVFHALPSIFRLREIEDRETKQRDALITKLPNGSNIIKSRKHLSVSLAPAVYWTLDDERNCAAGLLAQNKQISVPSYDENKGAYTVALRCERQDGLPSPLQKCRCDDLINL